MAPPIRARPRFPHSWSLSSGSFQKPLILNHQRADRMQTTIIQRKRCRDPRCSPRGNPACRGGLLGVAGRLSGHLLAVRHARACDQRLPGVAAQLAVVVPRAGLLAEGAGLAAGVLPPQPVAAVAGAGLREDSGRSEPWALVPYASRRFTFRGLTVPDPSVLRARIGAKVPGWGWGGLGERAGLVGRTGRGSGRGPRGAGAPTRLEGAGPGAG